jgi:hypothetical protein
MASTEFAPAGAALGRGGLPLQRQRSRAASAPAAIAVGGALTLLMLYAAFDHGAASVAAGARVQVVVAAIAACAAGALIWTGTLRLDAPRRALAALALLFAFAIWSGVSLAWSIAPNQTWIELNRVLTYGVVLGLAVVLGASHPRALALGARGFQLVAVATALYGIGQKLLPGINVPGLFNLNQTATLSRVQEPLGYWNALALLLALGVPIGLAGCVDTGLSRRLRLLSLGSVELLLLGIGVTYSRGGVLALVIGLAVGVALSGARLRSLMWLALVAGSTAAPLVFALANHDLSASAIGLGSRETAGLELGGLLIASLAALWLAGSRLLVAERQTQIGPERSRRIGRLLVALACAVLLCGVAAVALSNRGLTGTASHAWDRFTAASAAANTSDPSRLLTINSANRWIWWREAAGAFSDRPIAGWGAGSFGELHLLYRQNTVSVSQAHSAPLQFLAETGLIGAALALSAYGLLLAAGVAAVRRRRLGAERLLAAALLSAAVIYAVDALYEWDWSIPGVTLPALVFLGLLAGASGSAPTRKERSLAATRLLGPGTTTRVLALAGTGLALSVFAISGVLPSLAAGHANAAVVQAASRPADLVSAQASAELASRLDPLSDAGLLAEATIARRRGQLLVVRADLLAAVRRDPSDGRAWEQLAFDELSLRNVAGTLNASARAVALDPRNVVLRLLEEDAELLVAPPKDSPTKAPTPPP